MWECTIYLTENLVPLQEAIINQSSSIIMAIQMDQAGWVNELPSPHGVLKAASQDFKHIIECVKGQ